ncbi:hypothetical protein [Flavobacterium sp.]|uniref:hypothetical protein n=1 Tax=Flavobacterium sp. TaxID=239 RepID=UPI0011F44113|nr:hypothetical protein [Flavobacterium sp.]RZJ70745.1 MAG: hypothetical protein EOO49_12900 [Flavobacterium sp.]
MNQTEILLQKRQAKFVLYLMAGFFCGMITIFSLIGLIANFDWFVLAVAVITGSCFAIVATRLIQFLTYSNAWLVAESDGSILRFYNKNQAGKVFNTSEDIDLAKVKSFYVIKKRTRYLMYNYSFGYDKGGLMSRESVSVFPSLFEAGRHEMETVLHFVKSARPEIELGYENMFQKFAKR